MAGHVQAPVFVEASKAESDATRLEQGMLKYPLVVTVCLIITAVLAVAQTLFRPGGVSPEGLPFAGLTAVAGLAITAGVAYSGRIMKNSSELHSRWLARR